MTYLFSTVTYIRGVTIQVHCTKTMKLLYPIPSVPFYSIPLLILFLSNLFWCFPFCFILSHSILFPSKLLHDFFYSILLHSILYYSSLICFIPFHSVPFHSILFSAIPFRFIFGEARSERAYLEQWTATHCSAWGTVGG